MVTNPAPTLSTFALAALLAGCPASTPAGPPVAPQPPDSDSKAAPDPLRHPKEVHLADIVQLTDGGENAEAYWSFDGTQLIFQSKRPPYKCDQIMRMPADGSGEPQLLSTGKGTTTCSYFFPGDQEILFSSTHDRNPECPPPPDFSKGYVWGLHPFDIYKANADGTNARKLTDRPGYDAEATVCAVDGSIVFTSDRDGDLELYRMDADGGNVKRLTDTPGYDGGAFFNADCSKLVWRASRPQGAELDEFRALLAQNLVRPSKLEIFVADADGSNARQITYLNAAAFAPYFHPSGKRVLFSSNFQDPRGREFDIWAINVDGTELEQITFSPGFDGFPMFSPDGTKLAFASNRHNSKEGETNVFVARWAEAGGNHTKAPADRFRANVAWLADDAREGRGIGTKGLADAADWLEAKLRAIGVEGAMPGGGFRHPFEVAVALERGADTALSIDGKPVAADAFVPGSMSASTAVSGQTVFVGHGIAAADVKLNDYRGKNVRGKIAVVRRFVPRTAAFADDKLKRRYGDLHYKAFTARKNGAIGLIVVDVPVVPRGESIPDAPLPELVPSGDSDVGIPVVVVTREAGARLVRGRHRVNITVALSPVKTQVHNIVGKIAARAATSQPGAIVIGAHYDHLGWGGHNSLDVGKKVIHNGADDNASGTAALLEVARALVAAQAELQRDVYLALFTAEESGVLGSTYFVKNPPPGLAMKDVVAMLNMDMVGRLRNNTLSVLGGESAAEWTDLVGAACERSRITCRIGGDGYGASDHMPFYAADVPVLQFFSDSHNDYHTGNDDTDRINAIGGVAVAGLVTDVARAVAARPGRLTLARVPMQAPRGDLRARGGSLGTIPAYAGSDGKPGVLLQGVRPGSPAEKAGLQPGDRLVALSGSEIRTVHDFVFILRDAVPGQTATVEFIRDDKRRRVKVTFGEPSRRIGR